MYEQISNPPASHPQNSNLIHYSQSSNPPHCSPNYNPPHYSPNYNPPHHPQNLKSTAHYAPTLSSKSNSKYYTPAAVLSLSESALACVNNNRSLVRVNDCNPSSNNSFCKK